MCVECIYCKFREGGERQGRYGIPRTTEGGKKSQWKRGSIRQMIEGCYGAQTTAKGGQEKNLSCFRCVGYDNTTCYQCK